MSQLTEKMLYFLFGRGDVAPAREAVALGWDDSVLTGLRNLSSGFPADLYAMRQQKKAEKKKSKNT